MALATTGDNGTTPPEGVVAEFIDPSEPQEYTPIPGMPIVVTPETLAAVVREVNAQAGGGDDPPSPKTFLGSDAKSWGGGIVRLICGSAVAASISVFAYFTWINDSFKERPTKIEAHADAKKMVDEHQAHRAHPREEKILEAHSAQLKQLTEVSIQQTAILEAQAKDIGKIEVELRTHRNRHR